MAEQFSRPLIGDPDPEYLRSMLLHANATQAVPLIASTAAEVEKILHVPNYSLSGIFLNPSLSDPSGIPILRIARHLKPTTPIFYICDGETNFDLESDLKKLSIVQVIQKPASYSDLLRAIEAARLSFDSKVALKNASQNKDQLGEESVSEDSEFLPIMASHFISGSSSYFDVYVRLAPKKYVKILQAGDGFTTERLKSYLDKNVTEFYLRKEAQEQYLRYCDHLATSILKRSNVPIGVKTSLVINQGQETASFLKHSGLSTEGITYAEKYVENVRNLVKFLKLERHEAIKSYLQNLAQLEHGVATTMVAALLAVPLKFEAEKSMKIIGLATLFHDIGLQKMDPKFIEEDETLLNADELVEYHKHPQIGADTLSLIPEVHPSVVQAVVQHHERRNRLGFPNRLGSGNINLVAELIGISEEYVNLLKKAQQDSELKPLRMMESTKFDGFSAQVIAAFKQCFF